MSRATEDQLNLIHKLLAAAHISVLSDEPTAGDLQAAAKFLKDNDITASIENNDDMLELEESLKRKREKRKLRVIE